MWETRGRAGNHRACHWVLSWHLIHSFISWQVTTSCCKYCPNITQNTYAASPAQPNCKWWFSFCQMNVNALKLSTPLNSDPAFQVGDTSFPPHATSPCINYCTPYLGGEISDRLEANLTPTQSSGSFDTDNEKGAKGHGFLTNTSSHKGCLIPQPFDARPRFTTQPILRKTSSAK